MLNLQQQDSPSGKIPEELRRWQFLQAARDSCCVPSPRSGSDQPDLNLPSHQYLEANRQSKKWMMAAKQATPSRVKLEPSNGDLGWRNSQATLGPSQPADGKARTKGHEGKIEVLHPCQKMRSVIFLAPYQSRTAGLAGQVSSKVKGEAGSIRFAHSKSVRNQRTNVPQSAPKVLLQMLVNTRALCALKMMRCQVVLVCVLRSAKVVSGNRAHLIQLGLWVSLARTLALSRFSTLL